MSNMKFVYFCALQIAIFYNCWNNIYQIGITELCYSFCSKVSELGKKQANKNPQKK